VNEEHLDWFLRIQEKAIDAQQRQMDRDERRTHSTVFRVRATVLGRMLETGRAVLEDKRPALLASGHEPEDVDALARALQVASESLENLHPAHVYDLQFEEVRFFTRIENGSVIKPMPPMWLADYPRRPGDLGGGFPPAGDPRRRAGSGPLPEEEAAPDERADAEGPPQPAPYFAPVEKPAGVLAGQGIRAPLGAELGEPGEPATLEDMKRNKRQVEKKEDRDGSR